MKKKLKLEALKVNSFVSTHLYGGLSANGALGAIEIDKESGGIGCDTSLCGPSRATACEDCRE